MKENTNNFSIPIIGSFLRNFNQTEQLTENLQSKNEKEKELILKYSSELAENEELTQSLEPLLNDLILMGFKPNHILHSFLVYKFETVNQAIEILSEVDGKMNHDFIESDNMRCFICGKESSAHINNEIGIEIEQVENFPLFPIKTKLDIELINQSISKENDNKENNLLDININNNICQICLGDIQEGENYSLKCNHIFCKECVIRYLEEEIKNSRVLSIKCPLKGCNEEFTENILSTLLTQEYIYKYQKFLQREKAKSKPNLIVCPIVNCEGFAKKDKDSIENEKEFQLIDNSNISKGSIKKEKKKKVKYICDKGHAFCSICNQAWHGETECGVDKEIKDFATYSGYIVKKCPHCNVWTEKNEGCNHMNCKICSFNWCWLCEKECENNHYIKEGTPCFGKQFNEEMDPFEVRLTRMMLNTSSFVTQVFFLFSMSFFIIDFSFYAIRHPNQQRNNDDNNNSNNNNNDNRFIGIENNFADNDINENNNVDILSQNNPNHNEDHSDVSKCTLFCSFLSFSTTFFLIMLLINGYLLFTMLSKIGLLNSELQKKIACTQFLTYLVLYITFFLMFGPILNVIWLIIINFYLIIKSIFS